MTRNTTERNRLADRDFLAKLRSASLDELRAMAKNHEHKKSPEWKRVAIDRAVARALSIRIDSKQSDRKP